MSSARIPFLLKSSGLINRGTEMKRMLTETEAIQTGSDGVDAA